MEFTTVQGSGKCPKMPWMVEFHTTADGQIWNNQLKAAFAENHLEYLSSLQENSKVRRKRLTQLIVAVPPKVTPEQVEDFLKAGMTVALIRFDSLTIEEVCNIIDMIRKVVEDFGNKVGRIYPVAIALDISESQVVTGKLQKPLEKVELQKGKITNIVSDPKFADQVSEEYIYVNYENITQVVKPGDSILLGDDIRMSAINIAKSIIECIVERAGLLSDNLSVKIPNAPMAAPKAVRDEKLVEISEKCDVDMVFVEPRTISQAKEILGSSILYFLKIECASTVDSFDEIIKKADGCLVDGDKLMSSSQKNVFILQKSIVAKCNKLGKPVAAAIKCYAITKSEICDIANTIIDGVDSLLLPPDQELLESISLICKFAEGCVYQKQLFDNLIRLTPPPIEPISAVAIAAVEASFNSNAAAIILLTTSGRTAKLISRYRPRCPVIALTRFGRIAKQLMIFKAIIPIFYVQKDEDTFQQNMEKSMQLGMTFGKINGYIRMGDAVVIVYGTKKRVGFRNCMEVVYASEYDTIPE